MADPREKQFQEDVIAGLEAQGWVRGDPSGYDAARALFPEDVVGFYSSAFPEAWEKFRSWFSVDPESSLLDEVAKNLEKYGTLKVLRDGFKTVGAEVRLAQFLPEHGLNPRLLEAYGRNVLRVVPEVAYSAHGGSGRLDLVLFVNGVPTATLELKSEFTQSVARAVRQYRQDRPPVDPGSRKAEPLLSFKRGALVHFAVSQSNVMMTTHLAGNDTTFLPFDRGGEDGSAGNPPIPGGYDTAYLWEWVLARDAWLQIVGRFVHLQQTREVDARGREQVRESLIFPRYHQWDAVTKLVGAARREGPGGRYLVQHSAGSGKSNSIAWATHQLARLHDREDRKVFRSVIVVTDRTVLDEQLQATIAQFEHQSGVIDAIDRKGSEASKSQRLAKALSGGTPIIVVTLQTFPHVLQLVQEDTSLRGEAFAVIADEAHSSQSGRTAVKLREVLTAEQLDEDAELSSEDVINLTLEARKASGSISYFAFTATPKAKTLELFGRPPDPEKPVGEGNLPEPFHVYSMRQAIEEGFILDVLRNYVTYDRAYELAQRDPQADREVPERKAGRALASFVRLHPSNITQKVQVIVEHFRTHVARQLDGRAKAMIVTSGRKDAVRYKLALDAYARDHGYEDVKALVAFSGDVTERPGELDGYDATLASEESRPAPDGAGRAFSESSMNPGVRGDLRDAFDQRFNVLIVANKFQTGFDQPKLVAMYVDKRLSGIDAVQTLSRLNRTYPGKDAKGTLILDFKNDADDIEAAFRPYYGETRLASASDPDLAYDLQHKLLAERIFYPDEVERFAAAFFDPKADSALLMDATRPAVDRYRARLQHAAERRERAHHERDKAIAARDDTAVANADDALRRAGEEIDALETFRTDLRSFTRLYEFMSQIVPYDDADLEKLSVFAHYLHRRLPRDPEDEGRVDLSNVVLTTYRVQKQGETMIDLSAGEDTGVRGVTSVGSATGRDDEEVWLSELIERMNEIAGTQGREGLGILNATADLVQENQPVMQQVRSNPKDKVMVGGDFPEAVIDALVQVGGAQGKVQDNVLADRQKAEAFARLVLDVLTREAGR